MGNFMKCGAVVCSRIFESFNLGHLNKVLGRDIESLVAAMPNVRALASRMPQQLHPAPRRSAPERPSYKSARGVHQSAQR